MRIVRLPRGIPAASLKRSRDRRLLPRRLGSSAGNTRGLIEAPRKYVSDNVGGVRLPRGIPAASLKLRKLRRSRKAFFSLPRGIPAASLKHVEPGASCATAHRLPRGIPAASLKQQPHGADAQAVRRRLPRGIPAASLKRLLHSAELPLWNGPSSAGNTRGLIEARSRVRRMRISPLSSAGNTRGLIEAARGASTLPPFSQVFRGEYPRPH